MPKKVLPLPQALEEIRKALYSQHAPDQFAKLLARDLRVSADETRRWLRGANYPQPPQLRKLKELARAAGIEIAGSPEDYPEVTLKITAAIDAIAARGPMSFAEIGKRCGTDKNVVSHWRNLGRLPGDKQAREHLRKLARELRIRIEGL